MVESISTCGLLAFCHYHVGARLLSYSLSSLWFVIMPFVLCYPDCQTGWHVYGLLQRSDKKYDEAIKCYRNALKWDKVGHFYFFFLQLQIIYAHIIFCSSKSKFMKSLCHCS